MSLFELCYQFYKIAVLSDPRLQQLSTQPSFAARIRFADTNFKKIRAGSGRIAYEYSPDLVLKLAKNEKGIQQNITENDGFIQEQYSDIVANVIDSDPNNLWIVSQKASKITPTELKNFLGADLNELRYYLEDRINPNKSYLPKPSEELKNKLDNNELINELLDMMINFDMPVGDIVRLSSWGKVGNKIVLLDYGLTQSIFDEHYK